MAKEVSNNVLALVVLGVMVLSIISTSVVWFSVSDNVAPVTGAAASGGNAAEVGFAITPYNESLAKEVINEKES
tara:strand:+ start:456 stop:677 length:222 start_codon:yes stop_codon:yes gene_type:complete